VIDGILVGHGSARLRAAGLMFQLPLQEGACCRLMRTLPAMSQPQHPFSVNDCALGRRYGSDIEAQDEGGNTPAHLAASNRHMDVITALLTVSMLTVLPITALTMA
jgi:hypothetical protein